MLVFNSVTGARVSARVVFAGKYVVRAEVPGVGLVGFDRLTRSGFHRMSVWEMVEDIPPTHECVPAPPTSERMWTARGVSVGEEFARLRELRRQGAR